MRRKLTSEQADKIRWQYTAEREFAGLEPGMRINHESRLFNLTPLRVYAERYGVTEQIIYHLLKGNHYRTPTQQFPGWEQARGKRWANRSDS